MPDRSLQTLLVTWEKVRGCSLMLYSSWGRCNLESHQGKEIWFIEKSFSSFSIRCPVDSKGSNGGSFSIIKRKGQIQTFDVQVSHLHQGTLGGAFRSPFSVAGGPSPLSARARHPELMWTCICWDLETCRTCSAHRGMNYLIEIAVLTHT